MISSTTALLPIFFLHPTKLHVLLVVVAFVLGLHYYRSARRKEPEIAFRRANKLSLDPNSIPSSVDTIVIGSGPGACTCANLLAQSGGHKVLMLEQHKSKTGGGTHSFSYKGCEWDTGLHYSSKAMSEKTSRPGAIMDFMSKGTQHFCTFPEPYDEIVFPDHQSYPYMNGKHRTINALMLKIDPHDQVLRERVKTYMDIYNDIHHGFVALGISRILPRWLHFLVRRRVTQLLKYASLTVRDVQYAVLNLGYSKELLLRKCCPHAPHELDPQQTRRRLKAILSHPIGDYGTQPRDASLAAHGVTAQHYMNGGSYTVGPTQNISIRLTSVVRAHGGEVYVDATVREILVEKGRAVGVRVSKTSDMELLGDSAPFMDIRAKRIICGTSVYNLYNKLLPQDLPVVKQFNDPNERTMRQSNGHIFAFCKIKGDPDELQLPDHNVWYFHGDDLDAAFDRFYANPFENRPPIVYIGFPCTKDPTWRKRFPGTSNCIVISDGLYEWFEEWANKPARQRGEQYEALKESMTAKLLDILYEFVPQVKDKIEFCHLATPLTEESFLQSFRGGAYDTLCTPKMFAPINQKWITTPRTSIPGIYVAGSSAFFPGLTGSMYGGALCACAVLGPLGTVCLGHRILSHLASHIQEENPKYDYLQAYLIALDKFIKE